MIWWPCSERNADLTADLLAGQLTEVTLPLLWVWRWPDGRPAGRSTDRGHPARGPLQPQDQGLRVRDVHVPGQGGAGGGGAGRQRLPGTHAAPAARHAEEVAGRGRGRSWVFIEAEGRGYGWCDTWCGFVVVLTRALLGGGGGGGGGGETAPCPFPSIAQKQKGIELRNFQNPLPTSNLHILTKGKFHTYDSSAVSDVRVTSCFAILGKKIRVCGNHCHTLILKDKDNLKRLAYSEKGWLKNCSLIFEILDILDILRLNIFI